MVEFGKRFHGWKSTGNRLCSRCKGASSTACPSAAAAGGPASAASLSAAAAEGLQVSASPLGSEGTIETVQCLVGAERRDGCNGQCNGHEDNTDLLIGVVAWCFGFSNESQLNMFLRYAPIAGALACTSLTTKFNRFVD